jgi:imidazoleglycerol-phosphate dehydratase
MNVLQRLIAVPRKQGFSLNCLLTVTGLAAIRTTVPFLDHMLHLFARHGLFDLTVEAQGDIDIDFHHTVEDIGIVLGEAFRQALG